MGGSETPPGQVKAPKRHVGDQEALWLLSPIRLDSEVHVGSRVPGTGSCSAARQEPGSRQPPAISAAALHPLCFVRAAQVAACGQGFQHSPDMGAL